MSRIIQHNNLTLSRVPSDQPGRMGTYGAIQSSSPASNAYTSCDSETYCDYNPATGGIGGPFFTFGNFNIIPENATINSVSCNVKIRCSNQNGMVSATTQLYSGETPKGEQINFTNSTSTDVRSFTNTGTWTRSELDDLRIVILAQRTSNRRVYFYGADLEITYSYNETQYQVTVGSESETQATITVQNEWNTELENVVATISNVQSTLTLGLFDNGINVSNELVNIGQNNYTYTINGISDDHYLLLKDVATYNISIINNSNNITQLVPPAGNNYSVGEGTNYNIEIHSNLIEKIIVYDNGVNKTNEISAVSPYYEDEILLAPFSCVANTFSTASSLTNGCSDTNSTTRTIMQASTSSLEHADYKFNVSEIPNGAIINSLQCSFKIAVTNTYSSSSNVRLYCGNESKSNANNSWYNKTAATVYDITGILDITREELDDLVLRISGQASKTGRSIYFYGADLNIEYEYNGETYYLYTAVNVSQDRIIRFEDKSEKKVYIKSLGIYKEASNIYSKLNGLWVQQEDASNIFYDGNIYILN